MTVCSVVISLNYSNKINLSLDNVEALAQGEGWRGVKTRALIQSESFAEAIIDGERWRIKLITTTISGCYEVGSIICKEKEIIDVVVQKQYRIYYV